MKSMMMEAEEHISVVFLVQIGQNMISISMVLLV